MMSTIAQKTMTIPTPIAVPAEAAWLRPAR
jgi:hypothetical protein